MDERVLHLFLLTGFLSLPCFALLHLGVYALRRVLPDGRPLYEAVEMYLWVPAVLLALGIAGMLMKWLS